MTMEINPRSTFDINLTSLILKIQSLNDNRKSHYTKFWYYLLKKRYKKRDRLTNILKIQMFWFDPTKKVSTDPSRIPMLTMYLLLILQFLTSPSPVSFHPPSGAYTRYPPAAPDIAPLWYRH